MTLVLHHHPLSSCCWKTAIALDEKGIDYEPRLVADLRDPETRKAFQALWPTAKIPLLQDGDRFVPETSIQIEYLDTTYAGDARLLPDDPDARLEARLWDRLFDHYVMIPMQRYVAQHIRPKEELDPVAIAEAEAVLDMAYATIESRIGAPWAAGETFTMADCAAAPALFYAAIVRPFSPGQERLAAYFERLLARPSVARAIAGARPWFQYFPVPGGIPARFLGD